MKPHTFTKPLQIRLQPLQCLYVSTKPKVINFRRSDEVDDLLERLTARWGCDKTSAFVRALREAARDVVPQPTNDIAPDLLQKVYERQNQAQITLEEILETVQSAPIPSTPDVYTNPATIPGVTQGQTTGSHRCQCRHCGSWFSGRTKFASLCDNCAGVGHQGDPRDCDECTQGASI